ncbi:MAG: hypothetical protein U1E76_16340 [Planctomycetota bacterium]
MRSSIIACLVTPWLAAAAVGQTGGAGTPQGTSARLAQVNAITAEFDQAQDAFYKQLSTLKTDDERSAFFKSGQPSEASFAARLWPIIDADARDEAALQALSWIATRARGADQQRALPILMQHHVAAESIGEVCLTLESSSKPEVHAFLRRVIDENPSATAQGKACFALAKSLQGIAQAAGRSKKLTGVVGESGEQLDASTVMAQAEELFTRCAEEYNDIELYSPQYTIGDASRGVLFEAKHLQLGMVAPDIHGKDAEGVEFKTSDYRGKVVVVDFWGYW